jgi:DNA-3-methyladenine glycosylase
MTANRMPGRIPPRAFFQDAVEQVAPRLLGKILVRKVRERELIAGRIVEVEAYLGPHHATPDPASHSHRGPTPRNQVMFGPPGHAYVYFIYGRYYCMNITCEPVGRAGCILLRALEPMIGLERMAKNRGIGDFPPFAQRTRKGWGNQENPFPRLRQEGRKDGATGDLRALTGGPSRLCQALRITRTRDNGVDLLDARSALQVRDDGFRAQRVRVSVRIGIRHAAELPLRFSLEDHGCVSGPRRMEGRTLILR